MPGRSSPPVELAVDRPGTSMRSRDPALDALRAIAALGIFVYHLGGYTSLGFFEDFGARLDVAVAVFFALSGYLLYRPFVVAGLDGSTGSVPRAFAYTWRRVLRIVPAYWIALTVIALWFGRDQVLGDQALRFYLFGQVYTGQSFFGGIGPAWSLAIEVSFYALLPLWAWFMRSVVTEGPRERLRAEALGVGALFALSLAWKLGGLVSDAPDAGLRSFGATPTLPTYLDYFAIGMGLAVAAVALEGRPLPALLAWIDRRPGLSWLVAGAAFIIVSVGIGLDGPPSFEERLTPLQAYGRHYLYAVVALGLLAPAVIGVRGRGLVRRVLRARTLAALGLVSYAFFLWHQSFVRQIAEWDVPGAVADATGAPAIVVHALAAFAPAVLVAWLSWVLVERPVLRLRPDRRLSLVGVPGVVAAASLLAMLLIALAASRLGTAEILMTIVALAGLSVLLGGAFGAQRRRAAIVMIVLGVLGAGAATARVRAQPAADTPSRRSPIHYVAATFDGDILRLVLDGREVARRRQPDSITIGNGPLEIGGYVAGAIWQGRLDEIAVYRSALSIITLRAHDRAGRARSAGYGAIVRREPGLVGYWRLDEPHPTDPVRDAAGDFRGTADPGVGRGVGGLAGSRSGRAASFDGFSGRIVVARFPELRGQLTMEAWLTADGTGGRHVVGRSNAYYVRTDPTGHIAAGLFAGGRSIEIRGPRIAQAVTSNRRSGHAGASVGLLAAIGVVGAGIAALARRRR